MLIILKTFRLFIFFPHFQHEKKLIHRFSMEVFNMIIHSVTINKTVFNNQNAYIITITKLNYPL